jgi:hypothetical protein
VLNNTALRDHGGRRRPQGALGTIPLCSTVLLFGFKLI